MTESPESVELQEVKLEEEEEEGEYSEDGEDEGIEDLAIKNRTLKDVILGNHLPPKLLGVAIISFVVSFEAFILIAGILIDKYYSLCFSVPFILVPAFWGWLFFLSRNNFRTSASLQRTLQSLMLGYFADTAIYLLQWFVVYLLLQVISYVYNAFDKSQAVLLFSAVWETLFQSILLEALPEELLKFAIIYHMSTLGGLPSKYSAIVYVVFASMGFIFFSGTLRILRVYWTSGIGQTIVYFLIESILTSTMQIVTGLWIGLNFVKQQFRDPEKQAIPSWRIVFPSILFHAVFMSLISVMYLLYHFGELNWKLLVLICFVLFCVLLLALGLSYRRIKKLLTDPNFYALLSEEDWKEEDEDEDELEI